MKLKKTASLLLAGTVAVTYAVSEIPEIVYAEAEDGWVNNNGVYSITNNTDTSIDFDYFPNLYIDLSGITDWSIDYVVSMTIQSTTLEYGDFCFSGADGSWTWAEAGLVFDTTPNTVSFVLDSGKIDWLFISPWTVPANSTVTISNINIIPICRWEENNGVWSFTNHLDRQMESRTDYSAVPIDISSVTDWSEIQYITAEIWTNYPHESNNKNNYPGDSWGAFEYGTPTKDYAQSESFGAMPEVDDNGEYLKTTAVLPTYGETISWLSFMPWNINEDVTFNFSNVQFHTDEYDERLFTEQEWVELDDGTWYYAHNYGWEGGVDENDVTKHLPIELPEGMEWSDVQTISFDLKTGKKGGSLIIKGTKSDGTKYSSNVTYTSEEPVTITRNIRGKIESDGCIIPGWMGRSNAVYISNIRFGTEVVPEIPIEPNDILINESEFYTAKWKNQLIIDYWEFEKLQTTGELKIYTEPDTFEGADPACMLGYNDSRLWNTEGAESWSSGPVEPIPDDGIIRIRIDEEALEKFHNCSVTIMGQDFNYVKMVFAPDPDAKAPETEEITPDETEKEQLTQEFSENKNKIMPEYKGPKKSAELECGKLYVQKSNEKQYKGGNAYALRFVQKMKLSDLEGVKKTTMIICVDGKYVEMSTDSYYNKVSIDGKELTCAEDEAFIIFIIDNIPAKTEISFSELRFSK